MKRAKGRNFTDAEVNLLLDGIEDKIQIIENKKTDGAAVREKNDAWAEIAIEFNSANLNEERSIYQLKTFYDNFKRKKRRENALEKEEHIQTGEEIFAKKYDPNGERLLNMLKNHIQPDTKEYDSASVSQRKIEMEKSHSEKLRTPMKDDYRKLKLEYEQLLVKKLAAETHHMQKVFLLEQKKLENEIILQEIKIEQEKIALQNMKK